LYKFILYCFFSLSFLSVDARRHYTEVPALIHLSRSDQNDTLGFNLVENLPKLFYQAIIENKLKLWDSPKKQIAISGSALQKIESDNKVSFSNVENLFFNELWTSSRRKTQFVVVGFSMLSESKKGRISFGYIDFNEALSILINNTIPTNVNGPAYLSYFDAIYSRKYFFNLVQFGSNNFSTNPQNSNKIKNDAFFSKKKISGISSINSTKMVTYNLEKNPGIKNDPSTGVMEAVENYLNSNKEIVFNHGGDKYFNYSNNLSDFTITRIEITEYWEKKRNTIDYKPMLIRIYINNKPLNPISFDEFLKWQILFNFKNVEDILKEKQFEYTLYKINSEMIPIDESILFIKALKEYKWSQVRNFVKYSKD
jgi:hypothetical protein